MIKLKGKYSNGIVFSDQREESGLKQIRDLLDRPFSAEANPRFMPDYHAGLGSVIGTTMLVTDEICPNLVGVDIGCGIRTEIFRSPAGVDFEALDRFIRENIPAGFKVHEEEREADDLNRLAMRRHLKDESRLRRSVGTLGGGNHYIEVGQGESQDEYVLTVHSGSRNLGLQVAEYYQKLAVSLSKKKKDVDREAVLASLRAVGREKEIESEMERLKDVANPPRGLETLKKGTEEYDDYLHDMHICVEYALENRKEMSEAILNFLSPERIRGFETIHNYIEIRGEGEPDILRKGAVSAYRGELLTIPMNMRDGNLICEGLGNPEWNYSAPHGAGRMMSRAQARKDLCMEEYKESMKGIFTTSVSRRTLDEAPLAYKPMEDIVRHIGDTVAILKHVRPLYNFKSA